MKKQGNDKEEQAFLDGYDARAFEHPSVTVDVALVSVTGGTLRALLLKRTAPPCLGRWALPGGFVAMDESLDDAAARVLKEKAGLDGVFLEQLYTFGDPGRDPRTRVITVAYYALLDASRLGEIGGSLRRLFELDVPWEGETGGAVSARDGGEVVDLAFDHGEILGMVVKRLRGKLDYAPIGFELLPRRFTLRQLQAVHEAIRGHKVNKDSFRRRMVATGLIEPTGESEATVGHRPAALYRFIE